jgi:hypothetical protein
MLIPPPQSVVHAKPRSREGLPNRVPDNQSEVGASIRRASRIAKRHGVRAAERSADAALLKPDK